MKHEKINLLYIHPYIIPYGIYSAYEVIMEDVIKKENEFDKRKKRSVVEEEITKQNPFHFFYFCGILSLEIFNFA